MQQVRPEETVLNLHGLEYDKNGVLVVSRETPILSLQEGMALTRDIRKLGASS